MKWKQWKMGLIIAMLGGVFQAMVALAINITWQQTLILFAMNIGMTGLAYIKTHPEDSINFDTTITTKTSVVQSTVKTPSATPVDGTITPENK